MNNAINQEAINTTCKALFNKCMPYTGTWTQFDYKQCWVSECIHNRYFLVKSYSTIVAIIDDQNGHLFELGKWSPTTSKQITQLFNLSDTLAYKKFGFSKLIKRFLAKGIQVELKELY